MKSLKNISLLLAFACAVPVQIIVATSETNHIQITSNKEKIKQLLDVLTDYYQMLIGYHQMAAGYLAMGKSSKRNEILIDIKRIEIDITQLKNRITKLVEESYEKS